MATLNLPSGGVPSLNSKADHRLSSSARYNITNHELFFHYDFKKTLTRHLKAKPTKNIVASASQISFENNDSNVYNMSTLFSPNGSAISSSDGRGGLTRVSSYSLRKTKIVCTIGPSTSSRDMIWKLAEAGMNVARLNMSHGDHASHQKTIDLVKEYNSQFAEKVVAIMLDTKGPEVRSGDVTQPILLKEGQEFYFTINRGVSTVDTVSVNYDDFINDVEVGDTILVDGE